VLAVRGGTAQAVATTNAADVREQKAKRHTFFMMKIPPVFGGLMDGCSADAINATGDKESRISHRRLNLRAEDSPLEKKDSKY
jgi:hypothetical protein